MMKIPNQSDLILEAEGLRAAVSKLEVELTAKGTRYPEPEQTKQPGDCFEEVELSRRRLATLQALKYPPKQPKPGASAPGPHPMAAPTAGGKPTEPALTAEQRASLELLFSRATGITRQLLAARLGITLPEPGHTPTLTERALAAHALPGDSKKQAPLDAANAEGLAQLGKIEGEIKSANDQKSQLVDEAALLNSIEMAKSRRDLRVSECERLQTRIAEANKRLAAAEQKTRTERPLR